MVMFSFQRVCAFAPQPLCILSLVSPGTIKHHPKVGKSCKTERKKKYETGIWFVEEENTRARNENEYMWHCIDIVDYVECEHFKANLRL